jgi:uncharacterized protein YeaO (DUF488 family)
MTIRIKRVYEPAEPGDGERVLVDRLWPRGLSKEKLQLDAWLKDIAPSNELRKWFHHEGAEWTEFRKRYFKELEAQPELVQELRRKSEGHTLTLLYSSRNEEQNNASVLKEYLERKPR